MRIAELHAATAASVESAVEALEAGMKLAGEAHLPSAQARDTRHLHNVLGQERRGIKDIVALQQVACVPARQPECISQSSCADLQPRMFCNAMHACAGSLDQTFSWREICLDGIRVEVLSFRTVSAEASLLQMEELSNLRLCYRASSIPLSAIKGNCEDIEFQGAALGKTARPHNPNGH